MAKLKQDYNQKDLGVAFNRSNGQPLDSTEVWVETDENDTVYGLLTDYARGDLAYVGQKVTYIDINGNVYYYTIADINGTLLPLVPKFEYKDGILDIQMTR